jgi:hypothetical protein
MCTRAREADEGDVQLFKALIFDFSTTQAFKTSRTFKTYFRAWVPYDKGRYPAGRRYTCFAPAFTPLATLKPQRARPTDCRYFFFALA